MSDAWLDHYDRVTNAYLDQLEREAIMSAFGTFQGPTQWMIDCGYYARDTRGSTKPCTLEKMYMIMARSNGNTALLKTLREDSSMKTDNFVNVMLLIKRYVLSKGTTYGGPGIDDWYINVMNRSMELITRAEWQKLQDNLFSWEYYSRLRNPFMAKDAYPVYTYDDGRHDTFVNIMTTAGRYVKQNAKKYGGTGVGHWYQHVLDMGGVEKVTTADWERYEYYLMDWAKRNPEPTIPQIKLDFDLSSGWLWSYCMQDCLATLKTLELQLKHEEERKKNMSKIQEITGLKMGEIFTVSGYLNLYRLVGDDHVETMEIGTTSWTKGDFILPCIVNKPHLVERHAVLTEEQQKKILWLVEGGFKYVCKDADGDLYAYGELPSRTRVAWVFSPIFNRPNIDCMEGESLECLRSLVPDWTKSLDLRELAAWIKRLDAAKPKTASLWCNVGVDGLWRKQEVRIHG